MRAVRGLALLILLIPLLAPTAAAEVGVTLNLKSGQPTTIPLNQASGSVQVDVEYTLALDRTMTLRIDSGVVTASSGSPQAHTATWTVGSASGATRNDDFDVLPPLGPTSTPLTVRIVYELPAELEAGSYQLRALLRETSGSGGAFTSSRDQGSVTLTLTRDSGAGGGGAEGGPDTTPPGPVTGLKAQDIASRSITLSWTPVIDDRVTVSYQIHRSRTAGFQPGAANLVATVSTTDHIDAGLDLDTLYHYRVRAIDLAGNEGPFSLQLAVHTLPGPDLDAPSAVTGLRTTQVTVASVALAWDAASDNRGVAGYEVYRGAPGFTPSAATRIAIVTTFTHTDDDVEPSTLYSYQVRAVDAAGNPGPLATLQATTAAPAAPDTTAPGVIGLSFLRDAAGWQASWTTDETTTGSLFLAGPDGQGEHDGPAGATSKVGLGALAVGSYTYVLTVTDLAGNQAERAGRLPVVEGFTGRLTLMPDAQASALAATAGITPLSGTNYFADVDVDGIPNSVIDASGQLDQERAFPGQGLFLLAGPAGVRVLVDADGPVHPVAPVAGVVLGSAVTPEVRTVTVRVADKSGWISVSLLDPHPDLPLLAVRRDDGTPVPLESAWRDGTTLRFIDDPTETYTVLFDNAADAPAASAEETDDGWPMWLLAVVAGAGLVAGVVLTLALTARRRRA